MAVDITYKGAEQAERDLATAIRRAVELTDRSVSDAVSWAAWNVAVSIRSGAKIGKKVRKVIPNPKWRDVKNTVRLAKGLKKKGRQIPIQMQRDLNDVNNMTPFFIVRKTQGNDVLYPIYERKTTSPLKKIPNAREVKRGGYGFAKKIFDILQAKNAISRDKREYNRRGNDWGVYKSVNTSGLVVNHTIRNATKLPYVLKAYPGILGLALHKAQKSMTKKINEGIEKMEKEFK